MRLYSFLLKLYPASFRVEYGDEMRAVWARRRRDASGPHSVALLWIATLFEVVSNAAAVHWEILRQDLRYTVRILAHSPGFALTAVLVLALGVGANTAAFSVTDFVLIRPLPFRDSDRLVDLWEKLPGYGTMELSPPNYVDWRQMSHSFASMGAYWHTAVNLIGMGEPEHLQASRVTAGLFPVLGVQPMIGHGFTAAEDREGAPGTLLLSYPLWQGLFAGDPEIAGKRVKLDDEAFEIIGVMPRDFHFPNRGAQLWIPMRFHEHEPDFRDRANNYLNVVARLKPGVSVAQARAEMVMIAGRLEKQYPDENRQTSAAVIPLRDELSQQSRLLLLALSGAALCVLLISCANLANLLMARGLARQKELAVRAAIGAGRERLVRQLITESLVLALLGGAIGLLVAAAAVPLLARLVPASLPIAQNPTIDLRVLFFAGAVSILTGLGFGVFPAIRACRRSDFSALREGARAGGGRKERLRSALVVAEVMASVVLLVSAGLLIKALLRIQGIDPGFRSRGVLTLETALPMPKYEKTASRAEFYGRVLSAVQALPGVSGASYISFLPMVMTGGIWPITVANGDEETRNSAHTASLRFVTPGFFATMGIPLDRGRDVSESDSIDAPSVAVVSESFARRYWPDQDPLGRHFKMAFSDRTVVGVVGNIHVRGLDRVSEPQVYLPYRQVKDGWLIGYGPKDLVIHSNMSPSALLPAVRQIVHAADPEQPISNVRTMADIVDDQTASRAAQIRVLGAFAVIAFLLAGIGIHGLLSFAVSRRTQEIGVRIALGARPGGIVGMIVRQGAWLAIAGAVPGMVLAYAAARAMQGLLAGIEPGDAITFACASGLCVVMTILGSLLPALRAVRIDPIQAIRTE
ncbi:MAG TPA: ABC transporter permease [Bryobacteraceae bacterium]|nr:ABC transporter permease [Bryobacteraceae bacterium]